MIPPMLPMLATSSPPFDSAQHLFEVKWDGVRALAAVDSGGWRLWGRGLADYSHRYPELDVLRRLPQDTVVDGELVVLRECRADLPALLHRHHLVHPDKIRRASRYTPVHYVLFDVLFHQGRSLLQEPLQRRRDILADLLEAVQEPRLVFSAGVTLRGRDFFEQVVARGHEGVIAKEQASLYRPGQRSPAWRKVKPRQVLPCVVIGYTPSPAGFDSLLVAAAPSGPLRYVAEVGCGFADQLKVELARRLAGRRRQRPVVACAHRAVWVEPEVYCRVKFFRWTEHGHLRDACFGGLLDHP